MRICQLTRIVWEHGIHGGMERHSRILESGLLQRGHEVITITTASVGSTAAPVQTIYIPGTQPGRYSSTWWRAGTKTLERLHCQNRVDLVWSQSAGGLGFLLRGRTRLGIPCVVILHGTLSGEWQTRLRNLGSLQGLAQMALFLPTAARQMWLWWRAAPLADHFIAVSQTIAADAMAFIRVPTEKISIIPNGVDVNLFRPDLDRRTLTRKMLDLSPETTVLIAVGRLTREKGLHLIIRALTRLRRPDVHLLIVGQGKDEARLRRLARQSGLASQVHFTGFIPHDELPAYLNAADIFVMPTLCVEALPMTILEAMACGLPIVASDIGGIPTAIDHERNGLLFPPGDVDQLASHIGRLLDEPGLAQALGDAARAKAIERFSVERMVRDTEEVFLQVVHEARGHESLSG